MKQETANHEREHHRDEFRILYREQTDNTKNLYKRV